ncbi:MAG: DUF1273 domain-containing protein [Ruminococcaceae bacterium]|nr:DUF1273 domain-containing protein [Oscillospiraceae bacterium]
MMENERAITCCFTGHRKVPKTCEPIVRVNLARAVGELYQKGYRRFVAGGAVGFDTMAADVVLGYRRHYPDVSLILMLPCADQDAKWTEEEKAVYAKQKREADEVILLADRYYDGCMQKRNQAMVDASSVCIAYLTRPYSGAGQTVRMAEKAGLTVIHTAPSPKT